MPLRWEKGRKNQTRALPDPADIKRQIKDIKKHMHSRKYLYKWATRISPQKKTQWQPRNISYTTTFFLHFYKPTINFTLWFALRFCLRILTRTSSNWWYGGHMCIVHLVPWWRRIREDTWCWWWTSSKQIRSPIHYSHLARLWCYHVLACKDGGV